MYGYGCDCTSDDDEHQCCESIALTKKLCKVEKELAKCRDGVNVLKSSVQLINANNVTDARVVINSDRELTLSFFAVNCTDKPVDVRVTLTVRGLLVTSDPFFVNLPLQTVPAKTQTQVNFVNIDMTPFQNLVFDCTPFMLPVTETVQDIVVDYALVQQTGGGVIAQGQDVYFVQYINSGGMITPPTFPQIRRLEFLGLQNEKGAYVLQLFVEIISTVPIPPTSLAMADSLGTPVTPKLEFGNFTIGPSGDGPFISHTRTIEWVVAPFLINDSLADTAAEIFPVRVSFQASTRIAADPPANGIGPVSFVYPIV